MGDKLGSASKKIRVLLWRQLCCVSCAVVRDWRAGQVRSGRCRKPRPRRVLNVGPAHATCRTEPETTEPEATEPEALADAAASSASCVDPGWHHLLLLFGCPLALKPIEWFGEVWAEPSHNHSQITGKRCALLRAF